MPNLTGRWALVTGASSGIGKEYAIELAKLGCNVILVARRTDKLNELKDKLQSSFSIESLVISKDLAEERSCEELYEQVKDKDIDILINNAGVGSCEYFDQETTEKIQRMIRLNVEAPTILTRLFLEDMKKKDFGYIGQVASIAADLPTPYYAVYGATKGYIRHFSKTLHWELRKTNISHSVLNPGVTTTEFFDVAKQIFQPAQLRISMNANRAAKKGLEALFKNKMTTMPGLINNFTAKILTFILPIKVQAFFVEKDIKKMN